MPSFNKNNLTGFQAMAGPRIWYYWDTGALVADVQEVEGFFTTGYQCGMRKGDLIFFTEGDTGTYVASGTGVNAAGRRQYGGTVIKSLSDTGMTQTTVGLLVLIGDTS